MAKYYSNVDINTENWSALVNKINEVRVDMGEIVLTATSADAEPSNSNFGKTTGSVWLTDTLRANTLVATRDLRGGSVQASGNLEITSNVTFSQSANVIIQSNTDNFWVQANNVNFTSNVNLSNINKKLNINIASTTFAAGDITVGSTVSDSNPAADNPEITFHGYLHANEIANFGGVSTFSGAKTDLFSANTNIGNAATDTLTVQANTHFSANVSISEDFTVLSNTIFSGNGAEIGSNVNHANTSDKLFVYSRIFTDLISGNNTFNLGSSSARWGNVHTDFVYASDHITGSNELRLSGNTARTITSLAGNDLYQNINIKLSANTANSEYPAVFTSDGILPGANATYNLGSNSAQWNKIFAANVVVSDLVDINGNTNIYGGNLIVASNATFHGDHFIVNTANPADFHSQIKIHGSANVNSVMTFNKTPNIDSEKLFFDVGKHSLSYHDVAAVGAVGNTPAVDRQASFNMRVGNETVSPANSVIVSKESGFAFHNEWDQVAGTYKINVSNNTLSTGDVVANTGGWSEQISVSSNVVSLSYGGYVRLETSANGIVLQGPNTTIKSLGTGNTISIGSNTVFANSVLMIDNLKANSKFEALGANVILGISNSEININGTITSDLISNTSFNLGNTTSSWGDVYANNLMGDLAWSYITGHPSPNIEVDLSGAVTGTANANITNLDSNVALTIDTSPTNNSITMGTHTSGDYIKNINAGNGIIVTDGTGENANSIIIHGNTGGGANVSINNSDLNVIQDLILNFDDFGHISNVSVSSVDLSSGGTGVFTKTESDDRYIQISNTAPQVVSANQNFTAYIHKFVNSNTSTGGIRFGRSNTQYVDTHGGAGGNFITSISANTEPVPLVLAVNQANTIDNSQPIVKYTFSNTGLNLHSKNITGANNVNATNFSGNGASVSSVNAAKLNDEAGSHYLNFNNFTNTPAISNSTITFVANSSSGLSLPLANTISLNQTGNSSITLLHGNTSNQANSFNSAGVVIQDIEVDNFGHIVNLETTDFDSRYLTQASGLSTYTKIGASSVRVGKEGDTGDSSIIFYDSGANTGRSLFWDTSANTFMIEDNSGTDNILYHAGNLDTNLFLLKSGGTVTGDVAFSENVTITGNLAVSGSKVTFDVADLVVEDAMITLGANQASPALDLGLIFQRDSNTSQNKNAVFFWDESKDSFVGGLTANTGNAAAITVSTSFFAANSTVFTAAKYVGDGSELTGIEAGGGSSNTLWEDSAQVQLGNSANFKLYYDGSNNYMDLSEDLYIRFSGENAIYCNKDGEISLYYNNSKKLETSNTGVTVTGSLTATSFSGDGSALTGIAVAGSANTLWNDNVQIQLGTGADLKLYHNGTDNYIDNSADLYIRSGTETAIFANKDAEVALYYNNSKKLETSNTGVTVTGSLTANAFSGNGASVSSVDAATLGGIAIDGFIRANSADTVSTETTWSDNTAIVFGNNYDMELYHNGTNNYINSNNDLYIRTGTETAIFVNKDAEVALYYNNSKKLETSNTGVTVTGSLTANAFSGNGASVSSVDADLLDGIAIDGFIRANTADAVSANTTWSDNSQVQLGTNADLKLYHNGTDNYIDNTTDLYIKTGDKNSIFCDRYGQTALYYNGFKRLHTLIGGVTVEGTLTANAFSGNGASVSSVDAATLGGSAKSDFVSRTQNTLLTSSTGWGDDLYIYLGNDADLKLYYDGTNSYIDNSGDLYIRTGNNAAIFANEGAEVALYYNNSKKLETSNTGVTVTGTLTASDLNSTSDERIKTDIREIGDALHIIKNLSGRRFKKDGKESVGVIAQEIEKYLPEVVNTPSDPTGYKSVSYGNIVGVLIEAIKELESQVRELKGER